VALPFSIAGRLARGDAKREMMFHAVRRSVILILLGMFLRTLGQPLVYITFEDTLTQIGLGYALLFLLGFRPARDHWIALVGILGGYWLAFALFPVPGPGFDYETVGVANNWPHLMNGFAAHWNKNTNLAAVFDVWLFNLLPRREPFLFNPGGYQTLSFIPTLGTMILGLIAGGVLRSKAKPWIKMRYFLIAGGSGLLSGWLLGWTGICPVVKRIWTPSWTLYSGGWCYLLLAGFYLVIEIGRLKRWAFPLTVIGMNSILIYCMSWTLDGVIVDGVQFILGDSFGGAYGSLLSGSMVIAIFWLILYWLYRRRVFLRI
jgi:predicted acyltransferase